MNKSKSVLVIEDENTLNEAYQLVLAKAGYDVLSAFDGREALKEIKQHPDFKKIPIIVFTTTKNESEIKRCYELGANTYIVKPVSFEGLLNVLDNIRTYWSGTASIPW